MPRQYNFLTRFCVCLIGLLVLVTVTPVLADEGPTGRELRFGLLAHSTGPISGGTESGVDFNLEMLLDQNPNLNPWFGRMVFGIALNSKGDTSIAYAGRAWLLSLPGSFECEYQFAGVVHDGKPETSDDDRLEFGTRFLFRNALELGWRRGDYRLSVNFSHSSNAGLADRNDGLDLAGVRLSRKF